jgi:hypothetical protein
VEGRGLKGNRCEHKRLHGTSTASLPSVSIFLGDNFLSFFVNQKFGKNIFFILSNVNITNFVIFGVIFGQFSNIKTLNFFLKKKILHCMVSPPLVNCLNFAG